MRIFLILLLVVGLIWWATRRQQFTDQPRVQQYTPSCPTATLTPAQIDTLVAHAAATINKEINTFTTPISIGPLTISGIHTAVISEMDVGSESKVQSCVKSCVCRPTDKYPQGAALSVKNGTALLNIPNVKLTVGGLSVKTDVSIRVSQVDATIETDCRDKVTVTAMKIGELTILKPTPDSWIGKALAFIPDHLVKVQAALDEHIIGQELIAPTVLADIPLVCRVG